MASEWFDTLQNGGGLDVWSFNAVNNWGTEDFSISKLVPSGGNQIHISSPNEFVEVINLEKFYGDLSGFNIPPSTPYYGYRITIEVSQLGAFPEPITIQALFPSGMRSQYPNASSGSLSHEEIFDVPTTLGGALITIGPETGNFIALSYANFHTCIIL